jgi:hypothetical protein
VGISTSPMPEPSPQPKNGTAALLESVASGGDRWVKIATLALVALSGGGNFLATTKTADFNSTEINRSLKEIHDLHDVLMSSLDRQKDMYQLIRDIDRRTSRRDSWNPSQLPSLPTPTPR